MSTAFTDLDDRVDPRHTVLMVIDVQNDFCHQDGSPGRRGSDVAFLQSIVPSIVQLSEAANAYNVPVIYTQATHNRWTNTPVWKERFDPRQAVEGEGFTHCQEGDWGWEFFGVRPTADDLVIRKPRNSAFFQTHLELTLTVLRARTLVLTGIATGGCVAATAHDASYRDYAPVILSDCTATGSREGQERDLAALRRTCLVTSSDEVMQAWARRGPGPGDWKRPY